MKPFDLSALMTPEMVAAIEEVKGRIASAYPTTSFTVKYGEEPPGIYLIATIDLDDLGEVEELYIDRLVDLQLDEGLRLFVLPERPVERAYAELQRENAISPERISA